ncbi:MAG: GNAT family N-acetyltransferase, partial [Acidithiobacillus ferrivorans]
AKLLLDAAMSNTIGQRFYYRQGLLATALRFSVTLPE